MTANLFVHGVMCASWQCECKDLVEHACS